MDRETRDTLLMRLGEISTEIIAHMDDVTQIKARIASLNLERADIITILKDT